MGRTVAAAAYEDGRKVADIAMGEGRDWASRPNHFVWIGLHEPTVDELRAVQAQFGLHGLAIQDALKAHQRPKLETYGDFLFVVLRTARWREHTVQFGETHLFLGRGFVITVRHGASTSYADLRTRCEATPGLLRHGVDYVLHAVASFIVDQYVEVMGRVEARASALEARVFQGPLVPGDIERIYAMRRQMLALRRTVAPTAELCRRLEQLRFGDVIDDAIRPYFRDVADHAQRVTEDLDALREVLNQTFESVMLLEATRQNVLQRQFAAWASIAAVPTAIAGVYGMNFEFMPELHWRWGYFAVLGVIASVCGFLFARFRRAGWL